MAGEREQEIESVKKLLAHIYQMYADSKLSDRQYDREYERLTSRLRTLEQE
jgi:hypothetical protein